MSDRRGRNLTHFNITMSKFSTVRMNRNHWALSQPELAELLGVTQEAISWLENKAKTATLEKALALQVIFDAQPRSLFPCLYAEIEEAVMARAVGIDLRLQGKADAKSLRKLELLSNMVKRVKPNAKEL